jgi:predicted amidohydrolase YtcJ
MCEYNIGANVQSGIKWTISDYMDILVGEERSMRQWPLRTLIDSGVHVTGSSDAPVTYPNWKQGVETAVLRESKATGKVSGAGECISREEAIRTYTTEGAWQDHMENIKGSIEVGKFADFCVLNEDILAVDVHQIKKITTLMTIVGGKIVYNAKTD